MFIITPEYKDIIAKVCKGAKPRATVQAFENLLIEASETVKITAGDGQVEFTATLGPAELAGSVSVNADKFLKAVDACGFDCKVFLKDDRLEIKSGRRKFKLSTIDPDSYPLFADPSNLEKLDIDASELIANIKSLAPIAAVNDVRYYLNGVYVGDDFAATNGHRLASIKAALDCSAIIPIDSIKKLPSDVSGEVFISSGTIVIKSESLTLKSKLIDGQYPDYKKVAGKPSKTSVVSVDEFSQGIKDALITSDDKGSVLIKFGKSSALISATAAKSQSSIEVSCDSSEEFDMAFNGKYLLDALSFYDGDITLGFSDSQMVIDGDVSNVVMQVKL